MVRIITDTTAVLPQTMAERYHIGVAPQIIVTYAGPGAVAVGLFTPEATA